MQKNLLMLLLLWQIAVALHAQPASGSIPNANAARPVADTGIASFYNSRFQGRVTASGEVYDETKMTAAHNRLKFGTRIRVTNLRNGKSVIVKVNDRMHSRNPRLVDLSRAAAIQLGFVKRGLTRVRVELMKP